MLPNPFAVVYVCHVRPELPETDKPASVEAKIVEPETKMPSTLLLATGKFLQVIPPSVEIERPALVAAYMVEGGPEPTA